jgi:hypothetical protein
MLVMVNAGSEPRSVEDWAARLPQWFTSACAPELTRDEAERELRKWQALSEDEKRARTERWTLSGWTYWFEEENRWWYWWDALVVDDNRIEILVEMPDVQAGLGSLEWLLRAAGAVETDVD